MHDGGSRRRSSSQCLRYGLGDRLRACQGLHLHRVDVEHVACWEDSRCSSQANYTMSEEITSRCGGFQTDSVTGNLFTAENCKKKNPFENVFVLASVLIFSCRNIDFHARLEQKKKLAGVEQSPKQIIPRKNILPVTFKKPDCCVNRQIS